MSLPAETIGLGEGGGQASLEEEEKVPGRAVTCHSEGWGKSVVVVRPGPRECSTYLPNLGGRGGERRRRRRRRSSPLAAVWCISALLQMPASVVYAYMSIAVHIRYKYSGDCAPVLLCIYQ